MKASSVKSVRCAIYTRVSTEHGLDQEFNSLDCPVRSRLRLYQEPGPCRLDSDQVSL
jgi:hypothetical protein